MCPQCGDLITYVIAILNKHRPRMLIMENVPNLLRHEGGKTWQGIRQRLESAGYSVSENRLSPDMFGVPQLRERCFIVGRRAGLDGFVWPVRTPPVDLSIRTILDHRPAEARYLKPHFIEYLNAWQALLDALPEESALPTWPMWAMEFGATYPYTTSTPHRRGYRDLGAYSGSFGLSLRGLNPDDAKAALPSYAREQSQTFPDWKIEFIRKNREFYRKHQAIIDEWLPRILTFAPSFQKLEWNCKGGKRNIWSYVIQFRASGIRIKSPRRAPTLVAMTTSQSLLLAGSGAS